MGMICVILMTIMPATSNAEDTSGEKLYSKLSQIANGQGDVKLFETLNNQSGKLDWGKSKEIEFAGNLRILKAVTENVQGYRNTVYLLRK